MRTPFPSPLLRRCAPLLVGFLVAGCEGDGSSDPDGEVQTVELSAPDLRFGSLDGPDALVPVGPVALADDGSLWAAQSQDGEVIAVGSDGVLRHRVGGLGEGPGEFAMVSLLGWVGDSLWVTDNRNRRATFYGPDGSERGNAPLPAATVGADQRGLVDLDPADERSSELTALVPGGAVFSTGPGAQTLMDPAAPVDGIDPVLHTTREGGAGDVIATTRGVRNRVIIAQTAGGEIRSIGIFRQPWSDGSLLATSPAGDALVVVDRPVATADEPAAYRVTRIGLSGDTAWSTTRPFTPVPVDLAYRDSLLAAWSNNGASEDALRERMFLPPTLAPASAAFVGRDGRVWVGRERPGGRIGGRWDVYSAEGTLEMEVTAPARVDLRAADAATVWGVETDELDVPFLVRYRLPGG